MENVGKNGKCEKKWKMWKKMENVGKNGKCGKKWKMWEKMENVGKNGTTEPDITGHRRGSQKYI